MKISVHINRSLGRGLVNDIQLHGVTAFRHIVSGTAVLIEQTLEIVITGTNY